MSGSSETRKKAHKGIDDDLTLASAIERVEEIVETLESGEVSLPEGKALHEEATELLNYIEHEAALGDGAIERVDTE